MTNVFETPWLLLSVALVLLIVVWFVRQSLPEKRTWPLLLVPVATAIAAGALDRFVQTDYERIDGILERGRRAAVHEDVMGMAETLAPDYADRVHGSRDEMIAFFRSWVQTSQIDSIRRTNSQVAIAGRTATAEGVYRVLLAPDNAYTQAAALYYVKLRFNLAEQANGRWLIGGADLLEVNFQPMHWGDI